MSEKQVSPTEEPQMGSSGNSEQGEGFQISRCSKCGELFPESVVQRDLSTAHWPIIGECGGPIEPLEVVPLARLEAVEAELEQRRTAGVLNLETLQETFGEKREAEQQRDSLIEALRELRRSGYVTGDPAKAIIAKVLSGRS